MGFRIQMLCGVLGVCLMAGGVGAQTAQPATQAVVVPDASREALFAWFDSLGYPNLKGKAFVRVFAEYPGTSKRLRKFVYGHGWVLEEKKGESIKVFWVGLLTKTYSLKAEDQNAHGMKISYEVADFETYATQWLADALKSDDDMDVWPKPFGAREPRRAEVFLLSRMAAIEGKEDLSRKLYSFAQTVKGREDKEGKSFEYCLSNDCARKAFWAAVEQFGNRDVSRTELIKEFEVFIKRFPESPEAYEARQYAAKLTLMVAQDKARRAVEPGDWAKMSTDARARELVYQLRDQNGEMRFFADDREIFNNIKGQETPAARLLKMSLDAVPALIDALEDDTLARSVSVRYNSYTPDYEVLTVGDVARAILFRIIGRRFYEPSPREVADGQAQSVKEQLKAWLGQVQAKGYKQVLSQGVETGDEQAPGQALLLVEKYPEDALDALKKGYDAAKKGGVLDGIVSVAGKLKTQESDTWLTQVMLTGKDLEVRVKAARTLGKPGLRGPLDVMIQQWKNKGMPYRYRVNDRGFDALLNYLVESGEPGAIQALGEGLSQRSEVERIEILDAVAARDGGGPEDPATAAGVEALWVGSLNDKERRWGTWRNLGDFGLTDSRVCDLAAVHLMQTWPERYKFRYDGRVRERDRDLVVMQNVWRKAHGQTELPLPAELVVSWLSEKEMAPVIAAVLEVAGETEHIAAVEALVAKGPGGIKEVRSAAAKRPENEATRQMLEGAAVRMANFVSRVVVDEQSVKLDEGLQKVLKDLEGKELTPQGWVDMMAYVVKHPQNGVDEFRVDACRDVPGMGFELRVKVTERKQEKAEPQDRTWDIAAWSFRRCGNWEIHSGGWSRWDYIHAGKKRLNSSAYSRSERAPEDADHDQLPGNMRKALGQSVETEVLIFSQLRVDR
jgi:hypothetical protein